MIGGAYGDDYWIQTTEPSAEQWVSWQAGELVIIKVDCNLQAYQPDDINSWEQIKEIKI